MMKKELANQARPQSISLFPGSLFSERLLGAIFCIDPDILMRQIAA